MATHVPGPWQCYADVPSTDPNWHIVTNESRLRVLANVHIEPGNAVDEANARLIAAAPDLYDALGALVSHYTALINSGDAGNWDPETDLPVKAARAAMAKAAA